MPGAALRVSNIRKSMVLSYSFQEFGEAALKKNTSWIIPIDVRSKEVHNVLGGWPGTLRVSPRKHLLGSQGLVIGVPIVLDMLGMEVFRCMYWQVRMASCWGSV